MSYELIPHNNPNTVYPNRVYILYSEACSVRNMPKVTKLLSGREPRVLTLKTILFTYYYTTYYHNIDERP